MLFNTIFTLFGAGAGTNVALLWTMLYFVKFPDVQEKCRQEIKQVRIAGNINLSEGNIYLNAGNINLGEGNTNLSEGNINLSEGNIILSEDNIKLSESNVFLSEG